MASGQVGHLSQREQNIRNVSDSIYLRAFDDYQRHRNFSPATVRCRRAVLVALSDYLGAGRLLCARQEDVERWLSSRRLSAQGRYTYIAHLHAFFRFATRRGLCPTDPTVGIDRPKLPKRLPRPITPDELDTALAAAGPQMRAWLYLGSYAGLRRAEIARLERADVLDYLAPPMLRVVSGKGGKDRTVPLHPAVLDALRATGMRSGRLFRTSEGNDVTPAYVGDTVARFLRRTGIDRTCHSTRHHFGTAIYGLCRDLLMTRDLMGHEKAASAELYVAFDAGPAAVEVVRRIGEAS